MIERKRSKPFKSESAGHSRKRPSARAASSSATDDAGAGAAMAGAGSPRAIPGTRGDAARRRVSARAADGVAENAATLHEQIAGVAAQSTQSGGAAAPTHRAAARELDDEIDRDLANLADDAAGAEDEDARRRRAADAVGRIAARLSAESPLGDAQGATLLGQARQLLSVDYYMRQWGRLGMLGRSERVDDFGLDRTYEANVQPMLDVLYERYFRVAIDGAQHLPGQGAALLVCNHSGALPWDGVMLKTAIRHALSERRSLRWLMDDFVFHSPFVGPWLNRIGAVRACPENAERLLERGELLAVFPEGVKGIGKTYSERHQLQRFGRGGHIKLALRMQVPLIPVAIVGGEETYPLLYKFRAFSKLLGMPFIPITPLFPWLGPLGLVPLPSRWHIAIGEPMQELQDLSPRAASDTVLVNDLNERLRGKVQQLLQDALAARGSNPFR